MGLGYREKGREEERREVEALEWRGEGLEQREKGGG